MKQQFRFLIAGFSLIALLVYHAIPVEAQTQSTTFTASVVALSLTVSQTSIDLGVRTAGSTVTSDPTQGSTIPPIVVTNTSPITVALYTACGNAKDPTNANNDPSWTCDTANGTDMFTFSVSTNGSGGPFTALTGPTGASSQAGNPGQIQQIAQPAQNVATTVTWKTDLPTLSNFTGGQAWQLFFAAAQP